MDLSLHFTEIASTSFAMYHPLIFLVDIQNLIAHSSLNFLQTIHEKKVQL